MQNKKNGYLSEVAFALYKADYEQVNYPALKSEA